MRRRRPSPLAVAALALLGAEAERRLPPGERRRTLSAIFADIDQSHEALRLALVAEGLIHDRTAAAAE